MTVSSWLESAELRLNQAGVTTTRLDCLLLLEHITDRSRAHWLAHLDAPLNKTVVTKLEALLSQRIARVPMSQVLGMQEFYGVKLRITPDVLTPRPETEHVVDLAIEHTPESGSVIDIGTGSGAIAIAIASKRPDLKVYATEVSALALAVATQNAAPYNVKFYEGDLFADSNETFHTICANLPYVADGYQINPEATQEPRVAIFGGQDGLDHYRRFFTALPSFLKPGGFVIIEADPRQHEALELLAQGAGLNLKERRDLILCFSA